MKKKDELDGQSRPLVSLRTMFGILFFLLMIGTIILSFLVNTLFLERYYVEDRKRALVDVYNELQNASVHELLTTDEFDFSMKKSLQRSNMSLLVMDSSTRTVKVWSADESLMEERLYANIFGITPILKQGEPGYGLDGDEKGGPSDQDVHEYSEEYSEEDDPYAMEDEEDSAEYFYDDSEYVITQILEEEQPYTINVVLDRRARSRSIEMWGPLGESSFFLLRTPLEDVRSSAAAANRFFGYVGLILAIVGTFLAFWLSNRITRPLRQLTDISVRMKELDFSAKYDGENHTELDILGRNMNELSQKLEETISALRTANNDLQRDLDRRNREEEMRQDFLSNVTHELKTPIALIRGYAEGLEDGIADDPESRSFYLDTIVDEADKMNVIVQKVLLLNQLEFGDDSVSMERFDIVDLISNYLESASLLAQQEGIRLQFDNKQPVYVWGDPFLIQEVFQNYYSNALHHVEARSVSREQLPASSSAASASSAFSTAQSAADPSSVTEDRNFVAGGRPFKGADPYSNVAAQSSNGAEQIAASGAGKISASGAGKPTADGAGQLIADGAGQLIADGTGRNSDSEKVIDIHVKVLGDKARVTVFNTGKPIPEDSISHIWEKFYKVDKARTRAYGGSGVGLSIVKAIMDLHHRAYGADNYENGVAFWFELDAGGPEEHGKQV